MKAATQVPPTPAPSKSCKHSTVVRRGRKTAWKLLVPGTTPELPRGAMPFPIPEPGSVKVTPLVDTVNIDHATRWPDGTELMKFIRDAGGTIGSHDVGDGGDDHGNSGRNHGHNTEQDDGAKADNDAELWQASARLALLRKFGYEVFTDSAQTTSFGEHRAEPSLRKPASPDFDHNLSRTDAGQITEKWQEVIKSIGGRTANKDKDNPSEVRGDNVGQDLLELLQTSKSNQRSLQWGLMHCGPACQFQLHAHPNLELVYCLHGALYEVRMDGRALRDAVRYAQADASADSVSGVNGNKSKRTQASGSSDDCKPRAPNPKLLGPDLSATRRSWSFHTLSAGDWLVNEVGSIHKSFTATDGVGCVLLVLWGGSHANVLQQQEPSGMDITAAVETMDGRLKKDDSGTMQTGCECRNPILLPDVFIPEA